MRDVVGPLWARWKAVAETIAALQARILFTFLYFVVVMPFALGLRLLADPLRMRRGVTAAWIPFARQTSSLEEARRQF
jgi:hypothetical protein